DDADGERGEQEDEERRGHLPFRKDAEGIEGERRIAAIGDRQRNRNDRERQEDDDGKHAAHGGLAVQVEQNGRCGEAGGCGESGGTPVPPFSVQAPPSCGSVRFAVWRAGSYRHVPRVAAAIRYSAARASPCRS